MNKTLADAAKKAVTAPGFEKGDGYCQKWVRQVIQKVYGSKFDAYHKASAKKSALAWLNSPYGFRYTGQQLEVGDILYKTTGSGGFGHVGIDLGGQIAENSSVHGKKDARGFRWINDFGDFQVVVRLPEPKAAESTPDKPESTPAKPEIILAHTADGKLKPTRLPLLIVGGVGYAPVQATCNALGVATVRGTWKDGTVAIVRK
jgi:hypothetical protein